MQISKQPNCSLLYQVDQPIRPAFKFNAEIHGIWLWISLPASPKGRILNANNALKIENPTAT